MDSLFLFVTANEHERDAFEKKFDCKEEKYLFGKMYYIGQFGCYPAAYIHMDAQGVTDPSATPLVSKLVEKLNPVAVVMVGIAFGADEEKQKIGDVLVSDKILPYDSQKLLNKETKYKESPKEVGFQLLNAFREHRDWKYLSNDSYQPKVYIGAILTGSKLIDNYEYRNRLLNDFAASKPIGGEMEAQGIYSMCRIHGIKEWIIVKGICDWGYKKDSLHKEDDQRTAANAAVSYCHHVFMRQGVFEDIMIQPTCVVEAELNSKIKAKFDKAKNHFDREEHKQSLKILEIIESEFLKYTDDNISKKNFFWMIGYCYLCEFDKQETDQVVIYLKNAIIYLTKAQDLVNDLDNIDDIDIYKFIIKAHIEMAYYKDAGIHYKKAIEFSKYAIERLSKNNIFVSDRLYFAVDLALAYENLFDISPFKEAETYILSSVNSKRSLQ